MIEYDLAKQKNTEMDVSTDSAKIALCVHIKAVSEHAGALKKMRVFITAFLITPFMCRHAHSSLQEMVEEFLDSSTAWNHKIEPYKAPEETLLTKYFNSNLRLASLHYRTQKIKRSSGKSNARKEKRKIKELLGVLKEYACVQTFTTDWVSSCL